MQNAYNPEIVAFIDRLAETGSNYRMEEMEALYTEDLGFLVLTPEGKIARFSKDEMFAEFRARRDAGETRYRPKSGFCTSRSKAMKRPQSSIAA